jgi:hypothetical protein
LVSKSIRNFTETVATSAKPVPIMGTIEMPKEDAQIVLSEYGDLLNTTPLVSKKSTFISDEYSSVIMLHDNSDAKTINVKLRDSKNKQLFLFKPESHYLNARSLYNSIKKRVYQSYYDKPGKKSGRKNAFEKCTLPNEIFNMNRMVKVNIKKQMNRFGFHLIKDGSLNIKGDKPESPIFKKIIEDAYERFELPSFKKPDLFVPFSTVEGINAAERFSKYGIAMEALNN